MLSHKLNHMSLFILSFWKFRPIKLVFKRLRSNNYAYFEQLNNVWNNKGRRKPTVNGHCCSDRVTHYPKEYNIMHAKDYV